MLSVLPRWCVPPCMFLVAWALYSTEELAQLMEEPCGNPRKPEKHPAWVQNAHAHLLKFVQKNGSIYVPGKGMANYNTALSMMAMLTSGDKKYNETIINARRFLVGQQWDLGVKGKTDHPLDGGIGYGNSYPHSDLNNTLTALEAIYYSRHLVKDTPEAKTDLNWKAAISFIQKCQNLKSHNKEPWVSEDPENKGGNNSRLSPFSL